MMDDEQQKEHLEGLKISNALASRPDGGFENVEEIGKGAFGRVVKAKCVKDGEMYAIKIIPGEKKREKYQKRELELLLTLNLPKFSGNVIKYFGSWILQAGNEEQLCIQMELCSIDLENFVYHNAMGGPEIIKAQKPGQPRFYQHVFRQILDGIAAIHLIRWVHRDIHPGNILIANPRPVQISDIVIKIADFGHARHIGVKWKKILGLTIIPQLEKVSYFSKSGYFRAPELSTDTYDFKVDVYSAGMVLYFISRYLEDGSKWIDEIQALKRGELNINERVHHKDDKTLCNLIQTLLEEDPKIRLSALEAKEYMFPTQGMDSTDSSKPLTTEFLARKDEEDPSRCYLNELTLSAIKEAVKYTIGVEIDRQDLRQECMVNGRIRLVKINGDRDVEAMFRRAASDGSYVEIVVREQPQEDSNVEMEQPEPETEDTSSESL